MTTRIHMTIPGVRSPAVGFDAPFEMLVACHERVERSLALMERLMTHIDQHGADAAAQDAAHDVLRYFDKAAPLHHQDEELHVFPVLLAGDDADLRALAHKLMAEHRAMEAAWQRARVVLQTLAPSAADRLCLAEFASLYRSHLAQEDQLVYPAALAQSNADAQAAMGQEMASRRRS
jgi:iron-sulfur cluster repair protein YtfE (RIC family)